MAHRCWPPDDDGPASPRCIEEDLGKLDVADLSFADREAADLGRVESVYS